MIKNMFLPVSIVLLFQCSTKAVFAQGGNTPPDILKRPARLYVSTSMDGALLSIGYMHGEVDMGSSIIRFSSFLNYGVTFNYDVSKHVSVFTGIGIKNIGFIRKQNDSIIKYRTYNVGVPIGVKVGNSAHRMYGFIGGGIDFTLNYKEKGFSSKDGLFRRHRKKMNEWFSDRTPLLMPYVFVGANLTSKLTLKGQYYFNNFFNEDFTANSNGMQTKPYTGFSVNLIYLSIGINIDYGKSKADDAEDDFDN